MKLSEELAWRGFVNQMTFSDIKEIDEPRTFYWGVDPSADSMTIGHLAPAMMIRHFINHGHTPVLLVGGATGMIGDPDGKKQERDLTSLDTVAQNVRALAEQYKTVFAGAEFETVDNHDWFRDIGYLGFLRDIGKYVSMTQMLNRDFIKSRIGEGGDGISYAEFSYALIQGYDFLHLSRKKNVSLQVAGADQWGNSITGVELIRRLDGKEAHVFTTPLIINKSTGVKFGKSEAGAIWLDPAKTSPYQFYQFWLNTDDETAEDLIKIYTLLEKGTIEDIIAKHRQEPNKRLLQSTLATEVTGLVHGNDRCESVKRVTAVLFGELDFASLNSSDIDELAHEIPEVALSNVTNALVESGLTKSASEARRLIQGGGVSLNGSRLSADQEVMSTSLIKKGKNGFVLVR